MSDIRIRTNVRCIENYCNERLFQKDDSKEVRDVFRQILAHAKAILDADSLAPQPGHGQITGTALDFEGEIAYIEKLEKPAER